MEYSIERRRDGRYVIVADRTRQLVVCDSQDQAERLLKYLPADESLAEVSTQEPETLTPS